MKNITKILSLFLVVAWESFNVVFVVFKVNQGSGRS
mgnify:CR=1 FL=1